MGQESVAFLDAPQLTKREKKVNLSSFRNIFNTCVTLFSLLRKAINVANDVDGQ